MKVSIIPNTKSRRGDPVEIGNVYTNPHGRPHYKIVIGIMDIVNDRPWKNIAIYKVFADGSCAGACCEPQQYLREHQDLIGQVKDMPELKVEWLK